MHNSGQNNSLMLGDKACRFVNYVHLGIQGSVKCPRSLHGGHDVSTLALIWRDDADLFRLDPAAHEVGHNLLDVGRLCMKDISIKNEGLCYKHLPA